MILSSHSKSSGTLLKLDGMNPRLLRKMILLLQLLTVYHSSGQGAEVEIAYAVGIKLCKLKCAEKGGCLCIAYNIDKLDCHLSDKTAMDGTRKDGYIPYSKHGNQIQAGACSIRNCKSNTRCLERRGGGAVCVDDLPEKVQRIDKMSTQTGRNTKLLNITQQDLEDKWTTTQILLPRAIKSLTWSPLFASDLYALMEARGMDCLVLYNSQLIQITKEMFTLDTAVGVKVSVDTGRCLKDDSMNCVYVFETSVFQINLYCYREYKNPRRLELERNGGIEGTDPAVRSIIACNGKFGIFLYLPQEHETKKYAIVADKYEFTLKEVTSIQRLEGVQRIKWNNDGTFAVARSATTLYLMNDKEQVITKAKNKWKGNMPILVANDCILVVSTPSGFRAYYSVLRL